MLVFFVDVRCVLQMGGSDQWGNMVNGVDLGRRVEKAELFALTAPLITTSEGKKMGKSASGAVWLNADKLPEYDYWQVHTHSWPRKHGTKQRSPAGLCAGCVCFVHAGFLAYRDEGGVWICADNCCSRQCAYEV